VSGRCKDGVSSPAISQLAEENVHCVSAAMQFLSFHHLTIRTSPSLLTSKFVLAAKVPRVLQNSVMAHENQSKIAPAGCNSSPTKHGTSLS
jgi:hypothetical protein